MSRITRVEVSVALSAPQRAKERSHLASPEWVCTITNRKPMTKVSTRDHGQADGDRQACRGRRIDVALQQHAEARVLPNLGLDGRRAPRRRSVRPGRAAASVEPPRTVAAPATTAEATTAATTSTAHVYPRRIRVGKPRPAPSRSPSRTVGG